MAEETENYLDYHTKIKILSLITLMPLLWYVLRDNKTPVCYCI